MMKKVYINCRFGTVQPEYNGTRSPRKEEGFVFTTVKENPITSIRAKTVPVRVGASQASVSWKVNCCVWVKENMTFPKCLSYTTQW